MHEFIERMALRNAVNASLQRIAIYNVSATSVQKSGYRQSLKDWLKQLALRYYAWEYDGARYCDEIVALKSHLNAMHGPILAKMTIGICQKPITLWLKYLWLNGDCSKKPVFATLDRGIMQAANVPNRPNWPDIDTLDDYQRIVRHIDDFASAKGYGCGAVWEAETWSDESDDGEP
jgi:hypothetical protein